MYRKQTHQILLPHEFFLPFEGRLNENNRWVQLTFLIPWHRIEEHYANVFQPNSHGGQMAVSVRMALGSLIIQQKLGASDEETVVNITENPYLQYLIGLERFQQEPPFDASLMTHFRKRLGPDVLNQVNEWIIMAAREEEPEDKDDSGPGDSAGSGKDTSEALTECNEHGRTAQDETAPRQGKLLLDATCAPADIAFPTDLSLLNEAREKLEQIIDRLYAPHRGTMPKPRTYRNKARRAFLTITKQRRASKKKIRKGVGQQLRYVARDLRTVARLSEQTPLTTLDRRHYKNLLVIQELFRQQKQMYDQRSHRIEDRIVNLSQPHIRPIVRGKAKAAVEFGAKMAMSMVDGYARVEQVEWDAFNEAKYLQAAVEAYRERYGHYPEAVLADKLYRTRENLQYCKELGIRLSGPKLGRPKKEAQTVHRKLERRYGLDLIRARLPETSLSVISLQILVMNLERRLRLSLAQFLFGVIHCPGSFFAIKIRITLVVQ